MKIHMHLFCLIGALVTSITDGRISSSSSSSQRVGGSAVESTPNRLDLQRALVDDSEPHYCTATALGKQRGVVDWQGKNDKCNKCEGGQAYWPCGVDDLCTGSCTPKAVCDERYGFELEKLKAEKDIEIASMATEAPTDAPTDAPTEAPTDAPTETPAAASDCTTINLKKDVLEARVIQLEDTVTKVNEENTRVLDLAERANAAEIIILAELEKLKADKKSLEEIIVRKDASITELSLQIETIGVPIDPTTSQCNTDDGKVVFNLCRYSELKVASERMIASIQVASEPMIASIQVDYERMIVSMRAELKEFPVDCVDGYERNTGLTCDEACLGQCCAADNNANELDSEMNNDPFDFRREPEGACLGFTGLVHRDGSCNGPSACNDATIGEVQGPSCTGDRSCAQLKSNLVTESCNGKRGENGSCYLAEVSLIEGSCNGREYDCLRSIALSIIGEVFDPPPPEINSRQAEDCFNTCWGAYVVIAGRDRTRDVLVCTEEDIAVQPNYCAYLACNAECDELFNSN